MHLAGPDGSSAVELDTSYFVGNAPGSAQLSGRDDTDSSAEWFKILPLTDLLPDTRHRFRVRDDRPITQARLDIIPTAVWRGCGCSAR